MSNTTTPDRRAKYERKRKQLNLTLTPEEFDRLTSLAKEHGFAVTRRGADGRKLSKPVPARLAAEVVRAWLKDGAVVSNVSEPSAGIRDLIREVRGIGKNINQAMKTAHTKGARRNLFGRSVSIEKELGAIWEEVKRLVVALERALKKP